MFHIQSMPNTLGPSSTTSCHAGVPMARGKSARSFHPPPWRIDTAGGNVVEPHPGLVAPAAAGSYRAASAASRSAAAAARDATDADGSRSIRADRDAPS